MNIKVLRNKSGIVSGVVIPTEDRVAVIMLPHGKTIAETEQDAFVLTRAMYANGFRKGVPMFYRDKRVRSSQEFVRVNPDGSEDLVSFDVSTRSYTLIKNLALAGKGFWARCYFCLASQSEYLNSATILYRCRSQWGP